MDEQFSPFEGPGTGLESTQAPLLFVELHHVVPQSHSAGLLCWLVNDRWARRLEQDEGFVRRVKALAFTAPLHELDAHKGKLDWVNASVYHMAEIALAILDQVALAMDFDDGAERLVVLDRVLPFVRAQAPDRNRDEHERVATWVLEKLINAGSVDRIFRLAYGEIDREGGYRRRDFDFRLLEERSSRDGQVGLRASDGAINVLVGALDTDVESAQVAAEVKLQNLIQRGLLADARLAAQQARYRTIQFGESIRRRLDATRRDVRLVDWNQEIPQLLDSALSHIEQRFIMEGAILRTITVARDESVDEDRKRQAANLIEIVRDCMRRHTQLQSRLQSARAVFREEQDRQQFSGRPQRAAFNLFGQLLAPLLALPVPKALGPLEKFFGSASGLDAPDVLSLSGLVDMLLQPGPLRDGTAGPVCRPDLSSRSDPLRFDESLWSDADRILDLAGAERTLDQLLAEAAMIHPELPRLVALLAHRAIAPDLGEALRHARPRVLVAAPTGDLLPVDHPSGVHGDDLILSTAAITQGVSDEEEGATS